MTNFLNISGLCRNFHRLTIGVFSALGLLCAFPGHAALTTVSTTNATGAGSLYNSFLLNSTFSDSGVDTVVFTSLFDTPQTITQTSSFFALTRNASGSVTMAPNAMLTVNSGTYSFLNLSGGGIFNLSNITSQSTDASAIVVSSGATLNVSNFGFDNMTLDGGRFRTSGTITSAGKILLQGGGTNSLDVSSGQLNLSGALSGTGGLTKAGVGLLYLSGSNTYNGVTTISSGALQIGSGGTTGSIASASIVNNAALSFNRSDASTYAGVISGTGSVSKLGDGTLTLSGASTYTGKTTISAGTVALSGGNDRLSTSTTLFLTGGSTLDLGGNSQTLAGAGSSANGLAGNITAGTIASVGNIYLTSGTYANNWSGSAADARVWIGGDANATVLLTGANDRIFTADNNQVIIGHSTTGAAGVVKLCSASSLAAASQNVQVFSGTLDLNGQANVRANTIMLASGTSSALVNNATGSAASYAGNIALSGGMANLGGAGNLALSGVVSGSPLAKVGSGTLTLSGSNTYSGTTTISDGALQLGNGGTTGSIASNSITNNSSLIFNRSDAVNYTGTITGTGGLTKLGANTLTLSGSNSYSGTTTINAGSVSLGNTNALGTGGVWMNGGTLDLNGLANVSSGSMRLGGGANLLNSSTASAASFAGNIESYGTLGGAGDMTLSGNIMHAGTLGGSGHLTISGSMSGGLSKVGTGTATLLGNSNLTSTSVDGGVLSISGGSVSSQGHILVGGTSGSMVVTNGGSLTGVGSSQRIYVGQSGTGTFLLDGGQVTTDLLFIGSNPQSVGSVTIASGTLRTTVFPEIGTHGTGSLTITGGLFDAGSFIFDLGVHSTGHGILMVTGGTVNGSTSLNVGLSGTGTLLVNGGLLSNGQTVIGSGATSTGIATVSSGTWLTTSNDLTVGAGGRGTLNVTDTGVVRVSAFSGIEIGSNGTINLGTGGAAGTIDAAFIASRSAGATLNFNHTGLATFAPVLSGTLRVNKLGSGTTAVTSTSIVTGTTTISQGTLQFGNGGTTGLISSTAIIDNGTLAFHRSDAVTYATVISGSGILAQNGSGLLTLTGSNSYTGGTVLNAGLLGASSLGNIGSGVLVMNGGGFQWAIGNTLDISSRLSAQGSGGTFDTNGNNVTFASAFSGTGALVKVGLGTLTVTGSNSQNGTFTISGGALQIGSGGSTGSLASSAILNSGELVLNRGDAAAYGGNISGSGNISKIGTGTFTLSGSNTTTGDTTISAGQLRLGSAGALGSSDLTVNNGSLDLNGYSGNVSTLSGNSAGLITSGTTGAATLTVDPGALYINSTYDGVIQDGLGTVSLINSSGGLTLTGNNTYTGTTTISGGALRITGSFAGSSIVNNALLTFSIGSGRTYAGVISGTGTLRSSGIGAFTLTGNNTFTGTTQIFSGALQIGNGGTSGSLASSLIENSGTVVFNRSDAATHTGVISGTGSVSQLSTGTLTLAGNNTYTGTTTISAGTLQIGNGGTTGSIANSNAVVGINGKLAFNRSDAITYGGNISGAGSVTQTGSGLLNLSGSNTHTGDTLVRSGTLAITSNGALSQNSQLYVGANSGDNGSLLINGVSASNGFFTLGRDAGAAGHVMMTSGTLNVSSLFRVGVAGSGDFQLQGGSVVSQVGIQIGSQATGTGSVMVTGGTFKLANSTLIVGVLGTGTLNVSGGQVAVGGVATNLNVVVVGSQFGSTGAITLSGSAGNRGTLSAWRVLAGAGSGTLTFDGGLLQATANHGDFISNFQPGQVTIQGGGAFIDTNGFAVGIGADLSGVGVLHKEGLGTLTLNGDNTYSGGTVVEAGQVNVGHANAFGTGGLTVNNGTVNLNFNNLNVSSLSGASASGIITLGAGVHILTVNQSVNTAYAGAIKNDAGALTLIKSGTGALALSGSSAYTGGTTVNAGTLIAENNNAVGTGAVVIGGGVFLIETGATIGNDIVLSGGTFQRKLTGDLTDAVNATSDLGGAETTAQILQGTLSTSGTLTTSFSGTSSALNDEIRLSDVYHFAGTGSDIFVLELSMTAVTAGSILGWRDPNTGMWVNAVAGNDGGTAFFAGDGAYDPLTDFHLGTYGVDTATGSVWAVINHNSEFAIIPEPGTCALMLLGALGLLAQRRRRLGSATVAKRLL